MLQIRRNKKLTIINVRSEEDIIKIVIVMFQKKMQMTGRVKIKISQMKMMRDSQIRRSIFRESQKVKNRKNFLQNRLRFHSQKAVIQESFPRNSPHFQASRKMKKQKTARFKVSHRRRIRKCPKSWTLFRKRHREQKKS